MKQRDRRRASRSEKKARVPQPQPPRKSAAPARAIFTVGAVAAALAVSLWLATSPDSLRGPSVALRPTTRAAETPAPTGPPSKPKSEPDSFLDTFTEVGSSGKSDAGAAGASNAELEKQFQAVTAISNDLDNLKERMTAALAAGREQEVEQAAAQRDRLVNQINQLSASFDQTLKEARRARPDDSIPQWLSGELLMLVGGEPEQILPLLQKAAAKGLKRPRLFASLARAQLEANQFVTAYRTAGEAQSQARQDRYVWNAYTRSAFCLEQYLPVMARLERAFPQKLPEWAAAMRHDAARLLTRWQAEQKLRQAEAKADNLPRIRLIIEHRRFARGPNESRLSKIESTGREEAVLELFEDQAPATVSNFIDLVERGFYDGTLFHLAASATLVTGGDPNTKNHDPADDGTGGPGYVIPDEFKAASARLHFRGSLSMVNTGPHTAGSQFFITLTPQPQMDGHFTVFGRVIEGLESIDRISRGRTTREVGHFGKIIPGDLLVRAQVIRKRPHGYRVIKEQP